MWERKFPLYDYANEYNILLEINGGETGIRTLGPREGTTVFETAPFDHSGTSP